MCTTWVCAADACRSELSRGCSPVMKIEKLTLHELYFGPDVLEAFSILSFNVYNTPIHKKLCVRPHFADTGGPQTTTW